MILIADSGSTKTDWRILSSKGEVSKIETPGINPFYQDRDDIVSNLGNSFSNFKKEITEIYFYGAGCATTEKCDLVKSALKSVFPVAKIEVASDLLGAARALCGNSPGIVCILGTGSNSCYYNGNHINKNIPPLGLILGDEGSGAVMGKKLVADYLKDIMPGDIKTLFEKEYSHTYNEIMENVYRKDFPNRYLAGYTHFLKTYIEKKYCSDLVKQSFLEFAQRNILQYPESKNLPVSFTGSISYYFEPQLKEILSKLDIKTEKVVRNPIELLVDYHI
jgi:N-acetylglucosamine kinase-like BadF-type ATPase